MNTFVSTEKNIISVLLGLALMYALTLLINVLINTFQYKFHYHNAFISFIFLLCSFLPYLLGSGIVGFNSKRNGWLYGAITTFTFFIIFLVINQITTSLHPMPMTFPGKAHVHLDVLIKDMKKIPLFLLLGICGGWLGGRVANTLKQK